MTKKLKENQAKDKSSLSDVAYIIIPPDGGWGWVIVAASFVGNFVAEGTMYSYGLFLNDIAKGLDSTPTEVSLANSLMSGFYFFFGPIICAMINRWGYRIVGFTGGMLATIAFVGASFAQEVVVLICSYGLVGGIGFGMLYMPSVIAIGFYFERWRGVATSVSLCGSAVGSITIPIVILKFMKDLDWRNKFRCFAGFGFFCALLTTLYKPLQPVAVTQDEEDRKSVTPSTDSHAPHQTTFNKLNNQGYRRVSLAHGPSSFHSIRLQSNYSFKSFDDSTRRSMFNRSKVSSGDRTARCCHCCTAENFKHTCTLLCCCFKNRCHTNPTRPMYRDDIFYTGSLIALPEYQEYQMAGAPDPLDFHMSMTRLATDKDLREDSKICVCCPEAIRRPLSTMLDFGMFKSVAFTFVALSGLLSMLGFFIPLTYVTAKAIKNGMDKDASGFLLSTFGFAHLVGRFACAVITFFPSIKSLPVSIAFILLAGCSTIFSVLVIHDYVQFGFCAAYGLSFALILSLRPIMIVELFGLEKLSNSFGIMMMFYGIACLTGIPVAGILYDLTSDYDVPFFFAGGSIILGAVILIPVPLILKRETQKAMKKYRQQQADLKKKSKATTSKP